jgi:hypothetical protein
MAFDRAAFLSLPAGPGAAPAPGAFDRGAFLALPTGQEPEIALPAPVAPAQPPPGVVEAGARGLLQGVSFGFADEIGGALESAFTTRTYREARDEIRANDRAAREAHPWAMGAGELVGGLAVPIPGLGAIKTAATGASMVAKAAPHLVRGAAAGIVGGAGSSEGEGLQEVVQDAAKGGLLGAAAGGVLGAAGEKLFRGAPARATERLVADLTGGRATTAGKKIHAAGELVPEVARKFGLDKVARDADSLAPAVKTVRQEVGAKIGSVYEQVDETFLGVRASDVVKALGEVKKRHSSPAAAPLRRQIDQLQKEVRSSWGGGRHDRVPLAKVNELVGDLEAVGFASANVSPTAGTMLKRNVAGAVEKVLQKRMAEIQEFAGHVKAAPSAGQSTSLAQSMSAADALRELGVLNRDYKGLTLIHKMATERAALPPASRAAGGLRNAIGNAVDTGSLVASLATGSPIPYVAAKVGLPAARAGARAADELLAKLGAAAKAGQLSGELVQQALEAGIPRGVIAAAINPDAAAAVE